jgi:hypothetical protein
MTTTDQPSILSRRTALAGLGAASAGLAIASRPVAAQDATVDLASHPMVGLWQSAVTGPDAAVSPWAFEIYHADGTFSSWNAGFTFSTLGIWRPTGERTAEVLWIAQDVDEDGAFTLTFRLTFDVDETGDRMTGSGDFDIRDRDGIQVAAVPGVAPVSTRVTFDVNPATGSTASQAPDAAATPTT